MPSSSKFAVCGLRGQRISPANEIDVDGDVSGAHPIAVRNGGKPLHPRTQKFGEQLGLGLTHLREGLGHLGHRAVVLADLLANGSRNRRGGVAIGGQGLCQRLDRISLGVLLPQRPVPGLDVVHPSLGDGVEGVRATGPGELPQGSDGKRVIGRVVVGATGIGEAEHPGRASSPPSPEDSLFPGLDDPVLGEGGEMTTDGRGSETQSVGKLSSRRRAIVQNRRDDALPGRTVRDHTMLSSTRFQREVGRILPIRNVTKGLYRRGCVGRRQGVRGFHNPIVA